MKNLKNKKYDKIRNFAVLEVEFIRKDRSHGFARISLNNIRDKNHRITKIRGVTTDITEQKKKEIAMQQRIDELEKKLGKKE